MRDRVDILLIGYDSDCVQRLREAFSEAVERDHQLHVVRSDEEALNFLYRRAPHLDAPYPDIALLDVNAPMLDGEQVLAAVKNDSDLQQLPILVLSRSAGDDEVVRAYESCANAYLVDPGNSDEFTDLVRAVDEFWLNRVQLPPPGT